MKSNKKLASINKLNLFKKIKKDFKKSQKRKPSSYKVSQNPLIPTAFADSLLDERLNEYLNTIEEIAKTERHECSTDSWCAFMTCIKTQVDHQILDQIKNEEVRLAFVEKIPEVTTDSSVAAKLSNLFSKTNLDNVISKKTMDRVSKSFSASKTMLQKLPEMMSFLAGGSDSENVYQHIRAFINFYIVNKIKYEEHGGVRNSEYSFYHHYAFYMKLYDGGLRSLKEIYSHSLALRTGSDGGKFMFDCVNCLATLLGENIDNPDYQTKKPLYFVTAYLIEALKDLDGNSSDLNSNFKALAYKDMLKNFVTIGGADKWALTQSYWFNSYQHSLSETLRQHGFSRYPEILYNYIPKDYKSHTGIKEELMNLIP